MNKDRDAADEVLDTKELSKLNSCPFCGHAPSASNFFDGFFWYWRVRCKMCTVMMERVSLRHEPIDVIAMYWNRRYQ